MSWPKLLVPMALGQTIGMHHRARPSWEGLGLGVAFSVFALLFIVLLNDWGDREVDRIKRRMFPSGCSPKTIPDGILPAHHLFIAGSLAGLIAAAVAFGAELWDRPQAGWMGLACLGLFVAYTLPPLRLNYRGGGELLEMAGTGIALPWFNAYLQCGETSPRGLCALWGFTALCLASAVASGLSDEQSDRRGGKRTVVTMAGNALSRRLAEASMAAGAMVWALTALSQQDAIRWGLLGGSAVVVLRLRRVLRESSRATTNAFAAQARYKSHLHAGAWRGALLVGLALGAAAWGAWP